MQRSDEPVSLPGFGLIEASRVLHQDDLFLVVRDKYPVSAGHCLIIPKRTVVRFGQLTPEEKARLMTWMDWAIAHLESTLVPMPGGFNIGLNDGAAAGSRS
jgi:diadenosine tetraphosphate (Ap4A) HIT family hydrolase